jgi:hypothetical protein
MRLLLAIFLLALNACGSDDSEMPATTATLSDEKVIREFSISGTNGTINQTSKTILFVISDVDMMLTPTIIISDNATVSPASGIAQDFSSPITYTVTAEDESTVSYVVTVESSVIEFTYNGKKYEMVKENKTWSDAAAFAVARGGYLAEIDDLEEQNALYNNVANSSIFADNTIAINGGDAAYIWLGGNDIGAEGNWMWDGNNDQTGSQFWMGTQTGTPVDDRYTNWGNEPDDFGSGQDGLGLAITDWPLGVAGQWNDLGTDNELYFLIEMD